MGFPAPDGAHGPEALCKTREVFRMLQNGVFLSKIFADGGCSRHSEKNRCLGVGKKHCSIRSDHGHRKGRILDKRAESGFALPELSSPLVHLLLKDLLAADNGVDEKRHGKGDQYSADQGDPPGAGGMAGVESVSGVNLGDERLAEEQDWSDRAKVAS